MLDKLQKSDRCFSQDKDKKYYSQIQAKVQNYNFPVLNDSFYRNNNQTKYRLKLKQTDKKIDSVTQDRTFDLIIVQNDLQQQLLKKISNNETKQKKLVQKRNYLQSGDTSFRIKKSEVQEIKRISQSVDESQFILKQQPITPFDNSLNDLDHETKKIFIGTQKEQSRQQNKKGVELSMDLSQIKILDEQEIQINSQMLSQYEEIQINPLNIDLTFNQKYRNDILPSSISNQNASQDQSHNQVKPKLANINEEEIKQFITKITDAQFANLSNLRITRQQLKNHLTQRYGERISERFVYFFEFPHLSDVQTYMQWAVIFNYLYPVDWIYFFFYIYDQNEDRVICNTDLFNCTIGHIGGKETSQALKNDVLKIYNYVVQDLNFQKQSIQQIHNLLRSDLMKQNNLNITQLHRVLKRKREERRVTVKRNTIFLNNFGAIDFFINQNIQQHYNFQEFFSEKKPFSFNPQSGFSINLIHFNNIFGNQIPEVLIDIMNYIGLGISSVWRDSLNKKKIINKIIYPDLEENPVKQENEKYKKKSNSFEEFLKSHNVKIRVME